MLVAGEFAGPFGGKIDDGVRNNREIAHRSAGDSVGEMTAIDIQKKRSASIIAMEDCVVASVSEPDFARIASKHPELWRYLAKTIS